MSTNDVERAAQEVSKLGGANPSYSSDNNRKKAAKRMIRRTVDIFKLSDSVINAITGVLPNLLNFTAANAPWGHTTPVNTRVLGVRLRWATAQDNTPNANLEFRWVPTDGNVSNGRAFALVNVNAGNSGQVLYATISNFANAVVPANSTITFSLEKAGAGKIVNSVHVSLDLEDEGVDHYGA
jgi:hypothetical protein